MDQVPVNTKVLEENQIVVPKKEETEVAHMKRVEKRVRSYFSDIPVLAEIAYCESRFRHFDMDSEGELFRGEINNKDVGVMQINERYHLDQAEKLGFNIHTFEGNLAYARYLYEKEGTKPWNSSKACWGKSLASA